MRLRLIIPTIILMLYCTALGRVFAEESTWVKINDSIYGAQANILGPIGGGNGYTSFINQGDYTVKNLDTLLSALSKAEAGQIIYIPGEVEIDLTAQIYIEQLVLEVPAGVTLAGDRGRNGSKGALLTSDALKTPAVIQAAGSNVRITGLRIQGPNPKRYLSHHRRAFGKNGRGREYYNKFPVSNGIMTTYPRLEVDNCEISAFAEAGIHLLNGDGHHIHHNFIHHCQYQGLGYGICQNTASSLIEYNEFNWNRHSIAGTGRPGCSYVARYNIESGVSLSHCFDMHGGRDRKDGTNIAGTSIEIYNNTFKAPQIAVRIRGLPQDNCRIHHNWFQKHNKASKAVRVPRSRGKIKIYNNACGGKPQIAE